ncbi:flagellar export chaperone FliS [Paenibacillus sp. FSL M7-1455]|jgi:flagellar protein FliS|uniref:flagellar export chaperone FliS n=1 Tax=Paenibacillus sp. FSL M7-1455 TaxID=2975316 RepID=UPI0030F7F3B6
MQNAQQQHMQYLKVQVETASPGELTLMLYQEVVKTLLKAKKLYSLGMNEDLNQALHKVRSIFNELIITLDLKYEISHELRDLYLFYNQHLTNFIINKDEAVLDDTLEFARGMVETWKQALTLVKTGGSISNV